MDREASQLIVVANRAPHQPQRDAYGRLQLIRSASGVVNAMAPMLQTRDAVWVAEGTGVDSLVADQHSVRVRDGRCAYTLRQVHLDPLERRGYYEGFANGGLWPLCHRTPVEPLFRPRDFQAYERVNRRFADAVSAEARQASPDVFIQDYHFAMAPQLIRKQLPMAAIATFWHIPWPSVDRWQTCPWSRCLLEGILASDTAGFQTHRDRHNFLQCVKRIGVDVDEATASVEYRGRHVRTGVYPASIDWPGTWASAGPIDACRQEIRRALFMGDDAYVAVGVDRLDYTKGLEQKFLAVERLLEREPGLVGRFALLQIAEPTRVGVQAYQEYRARVLRAAERINTRFGGTRPAPIVVRERHHEPDEIARLFRGADLCYVASLQDGMNLVSKEFVCARDDQQGVLLLSAFAGAAEELTTAVQVNPYDIDRAAASLGYALAMSSDEQAVRMRQLRRVVAAADASRWGARILADLHGAARPAPPKSSDTLAHAITCFRLPGAASRRLSPARTAGRGAARREVAAECGHQSRDR